MYPFFLISFVKCSSLCILNKKGNFFFCTCEKKKKKKNNRKKNSYGIHMII